MIGAHSRSLALVTGAFALLCLLLAGVVRRQAPLLPPDGIAVVTPIAPGRALSLTLWTHDLAFSDSFTTAGLTRQRPGPLRITVALLSASGGGERRLAVLRVPTWPLVVAATSLAAAGGLLWPGRVRRTNG